MRPGNCRVPDRPLDAGVTVLTPRSAIDAIEPPNRSPNEDVAGRIRAAQLHEVFRFTPLTMLVNVVNAGLVANTIADQVSHRAIALWMSAILAVVVFGSRAWYEGKRRAPRPRASERAFRRAAMHAGVLASLWAVVAVAWFPFVDAEAQLVLGTVVTGMLCAGGFVLATVPPASGAYIGVLSVGAFSALALSQSPYRLPMMGLLAAYGAIVYVSARATSRLFVDRLMAEYDLRERGQVIDLLLAEFDQNGSDWLFELDGDFTITEHSARFAEVSAARDGSLVGRPFLDLLDAVSRQRLGERLTSGNPFRDVEVAAIVAGETRWWSIGASPILDDQRAIAGWRGVGSDSTDVRRAREEIAWMAQTDILTGLRNRSAFRTRAAEALIESRRRGEAMAIACVDLDHFKTVNDTLGHPAGDDLLREVAAELRAIEGATIAVGRLGGDEFGILYWGSATAQEVQAHAESVIARVARAYTIQGTRVTVGASVGIAFGPEDGDTVDTLIRNADLALYRSKDNGRGTATRYSSLMLAEAEELRAIKEDLTLALVRNEFLLHYHPIIDLVTGHTVAFEALVRWQHPTRGLLAPDAFVPIAESSGLIAPLGDWIVREACEQAAHWPAHLHVAVNLSPAQLGRPSLLSTVRDALHSSGLPAHRLEFEITEALFLSHDAGTIKLLTDMRAMGIGIALDDFGTGFSSLNHLTTYPVTKIKIDRSFVAGGASIEHRGAIIEAVTLMAKRLGCVTTAEGVETGGALAWISSLGCTQAQGYLFAKPMPAEDIADFLRKGRLTPPGQAAVEQVGMALDGASDL